MVYGQEKLVADEELEDFLNALGYFWDDMEYSAKQIAKEMHFGEPEPEGFPHLKPHHVYYFVQRYGKEWGMEPRRKLKKKKEEEQQTEVQRGIHHLTDMPFEVVNYLRGKGLLIE